MAPRPTRNDLLEELIRLDDTGKAHPAFNQTLGQIVMSDHEASKSNALSKIAVRQILNVSES